MRTNPFEPCAVEFKEALARENFAPFEEAGEKHGGWQWIFLRISEDLRQNLFLDIVDDRRGPHDPVDAHFTVSLGVRSRERTALYRGRTIPWAASDALDLAVATARAAEHLAPPGLEPRLSPHVYEKGMLGGPLLSVRGETPANTPAASDSTHRRRAKHTETKRENGD